ncbi:MAG: putative transposase [Arenicella sp.]
MRFKAIAQWALIYPIVDLCSALRVSPGAYYRWRRKPATIIGEDGLLLYREAKRLFKQTRSGIGYVKLCRALNKSGFAIGETRTRTIMRKLSLKCTQRQSYKSTANSNHKNRISPNVLDQQFNPDKPNQVWSTDITYLPTRACWIYIHARLLAGLWLNA